MSETQQHGGRHGEGHHGHDDRRSQAPREEKSQCPERVVAVNRIAKVVQGRHHFSFTTLVVVGDGEGTVGAGYGKAKEMPAAIAKGVGEAKEHFFHVLLIQRTIPHSVQGKKATGMVLLRPASPGAGIITGGSTRVVLECVGVHDVLAKSSGSANAINVVHATVDALQQLEEPEAVAKRRGLSVEDVIPAALLRTRRKGVAGW